MLKSQPILVLGTIIAWAWMIRSIVIQFPAWGRAIDGLIWHALGVE